MPVTQFKKIIAQPFQFSDAATIYASHLDLVNVVQESKEKSALQLFGKYKDAIDEMRIETYRSISEFGDALVAQLLNEGFGYKKTAPQGQYAGGKLNYFWKEKDRKWDTVGKIMVPIPDPTKVKPANDGTWKTTWGCFDMITDNRLKVWVAAKDSETERQVHDLVSNPTFGTYIDEDYWAYLMWMPLDSSNPVGSAVQKLSKLIRALHEVEKG